MNDDVAASIQRFDFFHSLAQESGRGCALIAAASSKNVWGFYSPGE
jgi:hypothetical protein